MNAEPNEPSGRRPPPPWLYRKIMRVEAPLMGLVGMTCRDFAHLSVTRLDRPLSPGETMRFRLHGLMCGVCRGFSGQFDRINQLIREASEEPFETVEADREQKIAVERVEKNVRSRL